MAALLRRPGRLGRLLTRDVAKKAAPEASGAEEASAGPATVTGLNIMQGGSDPPIRPDAEYPDWLWTVCVHARRRLFLARAHTLSRPPIPLAGSSLGPIGAPSRPRCLRRDARH